MTDPALWRCSRCGATTDLLSPPPGGCGPNGDRKHRWTGLVLPLHRHP